MMVHAGMKRKKAKLGKQIIQFGEINLKVLEKEAILKRYH